MSQLAGGDPDIDVLFDEAAIAARVEGLAQDIVAVMGTEFLAVSILKGSFIFAADLLRALHGAGAVPDTDFLSLSSYGAGTRSRGAVEIVRDVEVDVGGKDILLIDDILESGRTLVFATDLMMARGARRVKTCVLLEKAGRLETDIKAGFVGFDCPDRFVIGYGMDMAHGFRSLPYVGAIRD